MVIDHLKMIEDKKISELEFNIAKCEEEIKQYENLGKIEVKELARDYKKICTLIDCKKDNN